METGSVVATLNTLSNHEIPIFSVQTLKKLISQARISERGKPCVFRRRKVLHTLPLFCKVDPRIIPVLESFKELNEMKHIKSFNVIHRIRTQ